MGTLTGKTAVVLGASGEQNIGTAIARGLASEGARVVDSARREEPLRTLAEDIGGLAVACDVTDEAQIENLFETAAQASGKVDIAVFSAGVLAAAPIAELTAEMVPVLEGGQTISEHGSALGPILIELCHDALDFLPELGNTVIFEITVPCIHDSRKNV